MALSSIVVNRSNNALGIPLTGETHLSAMLFYSNTLPTGFLTTDRIKQVFSLSDVEALGIKGDYSLETKANGSVQITAPGAANDKIEIKVTAGAKVTSLGVYTVQTGDTALTVAAALRGIINTGFDTHGFRSAAASTDTVGVTAPTGSGLGANTWVISTVITGATTVTIVQFTLGANDPYIVFWYHLSEFFRLNPNGVCWVAIYPVPASYTFSEIPLISIFANGKIRQIAVYNPTTAFSTAHITSLQAVAVAERLAQRPIHIVYGGDISGIALSSLADLRLSLSGKVNVNIGQDGAAKGASLYTYTGKSITTVGAELGALSASNIGNRISWVGEYPLANVELDTPAFANGVLLKGLSTSLLNQLDAYRYIFLVTYPAYTGTFFSSTKTATIASNDDATIENNRVLDEADRLLRTILTPRLNSPVRINADGTLSAISIVDFKSLCDNVLQGMVNNDQISQGESFIDPTQLILQTSELVIGIKIVPIGAAGTIVVNLSYALSI